MKAQAGKARGKHQSARKRTQSAPLTRMLVVDALRSWVIPTVAIVAGLVTFIVYNIGLVDDAPAVTIVGGLGLLLVLFYGLRSFFAEKVGSQLAAVMTAFVILWSAAAFYPFYRTLNPGTPLFTADLNRNGSPVTVPLHDKPGRYSLMLEGHFLPTEGRENRTAAYRIAIGHEGATDRILEGTFSQEWRSQRIGAGRRSSLVPVMSQTTQKRDLIDDPDGHDVVLKLSELSPGVRDTVTVRVYKEIVPPWLLVALGVCAVAAALLIDAWRPKGVNEGLMATLTVATLVGVAIFRVSVVSAPGFPQLVVAALGGTLVGAIAGSLLWRLVRPLKRHLPALE